MSTPKRVYQIDFTAVASGKRIASSKRRVRWRFGFANPDALAAGEKGTACRGEEHDVTLVWSLSSGKRVIVADGQEIHYSNNRNNTFEYSWSLRGGHMLRVIAHASPPLSPIPGWRQYDFFVDGQSFFTFPKVYRLGLSPNDPRGATGPAQLAERGQRYTAGADGGKSSEIASLEAPTNPAEEEAYLQEAIRQSMVDGGEKASGSVASTGTDDLLNFGDTPADAGSDVFGGSASGAHVYGQAPGPGAIVAAPAPYGYSPYAQQAGANPYTQQDPFGQQPAAANPYAPQPAAANPYAPQPAAANPYAPQPAAANPYAPQPAAANPYAPQPAAANPYAAPAPQPASQSPWGAPPAIVTGGWDSQPPQQIQTPQQGQTTPSSIGFASPPPDFSGFGTPAATPASPPPAQTHLTMNSLAGEEGVLDGAPPASSGGSLADQAYAKLFTADTFSLMHPSQPAAKRDNPFENAALGDIKSQKQPPVAKKEVMKAPPPPAGSMVVASSQNGQWGGQYGGGGMMQQQQQPAYGGMQQQPAYGGMQQQPAYGGMQQQPAYGGMQQQPAYGQQQGGMGMMGQQQQQQPFGQQQPYGQPQQMGQQQQFGGYGQQPGY